MKAGNRPSLERQHQHRLDVAAARRENGGAPPNYRVVGSTAHIQINGLLTAESDVIAEWFGLANTTYPDIAEAVQRAEADSSVRSVMYQLNSGGGMVDGITLAIDAIDSARKSSSVVDCSASAAYWLSTRAGIGGSITALSKLTAVGSIGVAVDVWSSGFIRQIASTDAPNKRPNVDTDHGVAVIRAELDAIHDHDVAAARGVSRSKVNTDFGRGGLLLAEAALTAGMIDAIRPRPEAARMASLSSGAARASVTAPRQETELERDNRIAAALDRMDARIPIEKSEAEIAHENRIGELLNNVYGRLH